MLILRAYSFNVLIINSMHGPVIAKSDCVNLCVEFCKFVHVCLCIMNICEYQAVFECWTPISFIFVLKTFELPRGKTNNVVSEQV